MERLQLAQIFYIEYLKLMNHYKFLDKEQKMELKAHIKIQEGKEEENEEKNKNT